MRRLTVFGGTLLAMVAAAGVGAFVAAHSSERDAPSVGPTTDQVHTSTSPSRPATHWHGVMASETTRGYRSGGTCSTDWRASLHVNVDAKEAAAGSGTAVLTSGPSCPFVTGQPQVHRFHIEVRGARQGDHLALRLTATPTGDGIDYGGFDDAFEHGRTLTLLVSGATAADHEVIRVVPADPTDTAIVRNAIRLREARA